MLSDRSIYKNEVYMQIFKAFKILVWNEKISQCLMFKKLRAKWALPHKQALAIQPTEIFFDKGEKKAYFRLKGLIISWRLNSIICYNILYQ